MGSLWPCFQLFLKRIWTSNLKVINAVIVFLETIERLLHLLVFSSVTLECPLL